MVYFHVDIVALKLLHRKYTDIGISSYISRYMRGKSNTGHSSEPTV